MRKTKSEIRHIINHTLIILFAVLFLALLVVVAISLTQRYKDTIIDYKRDQLLTISKTIAKNLEFEMERNISDLLFLSSSQDYHDSAKAWREDNDISPMNDLLKRYYQFHASSLSDMILYHGSYDNQVVCLTGTKYVYYNRIVKEAGYKLDLWKTTDEEGINSMYLAIQVTDEDGYTLTAIINLERKYNELISYVQLGKKGYVMIKDSDGNVIMHKVKTQIGVNAVNGRQELYPNIKLELESFNKMIEHQKAGREGIEVYQSYWWAEKTPSLITKISAYTPARIEDGFIIVSAVIDYKEIEDDIALDMVKIITLSLMVFAGLLALSFAIIYSFRQRNAIAKENKDLKRWNETLQTLHDNEIIISHQQRLQVIGTMTGGIAHEFNNLLTPIMGYSGMIKESMDKEDPNYEDIVEIYDAANKAKEIIQQISTLSKRNTSTIFQFCLWQDVLNNALKMVKSIKPANIDIKQDIDPDKDGVFGNATQLNQIILNIFVNAFHAIGDKKGVIKLTYKHLDKNNTGSIIPKEILQTIQKNKENFAVIMIEDNGCGMDEATEARIFDPFFTTKGEKGGTGLGLSVVQNLLSSHQGYIFETSKVSKGSAFYLVLPLASVKIEAKEESRTSLENKRLEAKVLLVDDNKRVLKMVEKGLKFNNLEVSSFTNPEDALETLKSEKFDLIITDDFMNEMNGLSFAMQAKQLYPNIPIIIVTGMLRSQVIEAKQNHIISEYLFKPIEIKTLINTINSLLK